MNDVFVTVFNLIVAVATLGLGTVKALAVRRHRDWNLGLTASVLIFAGLIFLLATPAVYRFVGQLLHSPNISALIVPAATLVCVGHAHVLTQLWQPERREPAALRRTAIRWIPVYASSLLAMTVLYFHADLGPAAPLHFAATYAHVPEVIGFHCVYWAALITTIVVSVRECRTLVIPGRPDFVENLRRAVGWFAVALTFDLANVVVTAVALFGSTEGANLNALAESAWLATITSCIAANIALASLVLRSRHAESSDWKSLQPLHDLVVEDDQDHTVVLAPRSSLWAGFDTRLKLNSRVAEIHDGAARLCPWWSPVPSLAVERLSADEDDVPGDWDQAAARVAATLLYAAQTRTRALRPLPPRLRLSRLPGSEIEPTAERLHLVRVAQHLTHPLVLEAVAMADQALSAPGQPSS